MKVIVTQPDGPVFRFQFCEARVASNMGALDFNVLPVRGKDGEPGAPGVGVPSGGAEGQVLAKASATDYDTGWSDPSGGVTDVQVNGTSIVQDGVANVPFATSNLPGLVRVSSTFGVQMNTATGYTEYIETAPAPSNTIKNPGTDNFSTYRPITPRFQHESVFYALAKAAGDSSQSSSSNPVGTYTDAAKAAIQIMLGIAAIIGPVEGATALQSYSIGDLFLHDGKLYKATASIAANAAIVPGTNCIQTTIIELLGGN